MNLNRRSAIAAGLAVPLVAACGSNDTATDPAASSTPSGTTSPSSATSSGRPVAAPLVATADIEVGGGKIFATEKVVVTQPTEGEFKAFDAVCTHQQCLVSKVQDKQIVCTCHFSKFSISDGSVESGPAKSPLSAFPITVDNGEIYLS
ncbi:Rieske (2Fe-2S) protein [Nocardioides sp.]|uniref:Rieske (2Fe-2S) protein n=1 Tax=Nocardioides sp. TaxID=35761 RepID=UPI00260EB417|nr:Rieske (2Fe-2S) protein [Nocardioides sp.]